MNQVSDEIAEDRLYVKALSIRQDRGVGLWVPIMWHLALRGHVSAMIELADWFSGDDSLKEVGKISDTFSAAGLYYRAFRKGEPGAASNMALSCFNRGDMSGYRFWLRRAVKAGDPRSLCELRAFESRLWHSAARKLRRLRPVMKRDGFS
ncbi:hypothetical protein [Porphyrobacter sp. AAP82]|uniref:hypothetical protein n=1 Tax=Porphyrobacter sp. AAP82 TaxID=1248917 RepID=UPI00036D30DA|nr:hypothetical protein [Porphyrobacter sp. AAP82]